MDDECQSMRPWPVPKQIFDGIHTLFFFGFNSTNYWKVTVQLTASSVNQKSAFRSFLPFLLDVFACPVPGT